jgi:prepilin-type N-terminal cleavage/methylation domain-containing protein
MIFKNESQNHASRDAYTLIELVIVLFIMGLACAIAFPKYSSTLSKHRVTRAADRVVADLRLAKSYALMRSTSVYVDLSTSNHTLGIRDIDDFDASGRRHSVQLSGDPYFTSIANFNLGGQASVQFSGHGESMTIGTITLQCGAHTKVISLARETISVN